MANKFPFFGRQITAKIRQQNIKPPTSGGNNFLAAKSPTNAFFFKNLIISKADLSYSKKIQSLRTFAPAKIQ
jgi:hypothetical protein